MIAGIIIVVLLIIAGCIMLSMYRADQLPEEEIKRPGQCDMPGCNGKMVFQGFDSISRKVYKIYSCNKCRKISVR